MKCRNASHDLGIGGEGIGALFALIKKNAPNDRFGEFER
jgi:hypothetical protein